MPPRAFLPSSGFNTHSRILSFGVPKTEAGGSESEASLSSMVSPHLQKQKQSNKQTIKKNPKYNPKTVF